MISESIPQSWQTLSLPQFGVRLRVPAVTPKGYPVEQVEELQGDSTRLHIRSLQETEVYFELTYYANLNALEEYARHKAYLAERFAAEGFRITEIQTTTLHNKPAHQYTFQWGQKSRVVVFVQLTSIALRLIYDPLSPINLQILANLEWL